MQFFQGKKVLPLFIYYDDLEICNPLGSHASIQKLGAVFHSISCLSPQFVFQLENIFIALFFSLSWPKSVLKYEYLYHSY
jgi:hypothetical protein